jgi:hypothetical protein
MLSIPRQIAECSDWTNLIGCALALGLGMGSTPKGKGARLHPASEKKVYPLQARGLFHQEALKIELEPDDWP